MPYWRAVIILDYSGKAHQRTLLSVANRDGLSAFARDLQGLGYELVATDGTREHLAADGIATGLHYPIPLHQQKAYAACDFAKCQLPVAEKVAPQLLSLPMYPGLSEDAQQRVAASLATGLQADA